MNQFHESLVEATLQAVRDRKHAAVYCWDEEYTASVTIPKAQALVLQGQGLQFCADVSLNSEGTSTYQAVDLETATALVQAGAKAVAGWLNDDEPTDGAIEARKVLIAAAFPGKLECQLLYNLREATSWISGNDLHELFRELVGEPSPRGDKLFEEETLALLNPAAYQMLQDTVLRQAAEARNKIEAAFWAMVWDVKNDSQTQAYYAAVHAQSGLSCEPELAFTRLAKWARNEYPELDAAYAFVPFEFRSHRRFVGWFGSAPVLPD